MSHTPFLTQCVTVGHITMGGHYPIVVQSMTNTDTCDTAATVAQVKALVSHGCQLVRITVPTMREVPYLREIKARLRAEGIVTPLVADVHYHPEVAEACAAIVEKVRINPGNFTDKRKFNYEEMSEATYASSLQKMYDRATPLFAICRQHHTALRIGINQGSLCDRIVSRYGNTPLAMVMSAVEWMTFCRSQQFYNVVFSMKSSQVSTMVTATLMLAEKMREMALSFPLHIGVTEAGAGDEGRVKSAVGIGALLLSGVGNTIRVSLTEDPNDELPTAHILSHIHDYATQVVQHLDGTSLSLHYDEQDYEKMMVVTAAVAGYIHHHHGIKEVTISNPHFSSAVCQKVSDMILQACRIKMTQTEIISCPSCGRTRYNIQEALKQVKQRFSNYPDLKLGVMGCVVNGPGEMADADFGIVGASHDKVIVYKKQKAYTAPITLEEAMQVLEQLIKERES